MYKKIFKYFLTITIVLFIIGLTGCNNNLEKETDNDVTVENNTEDTSNNGEIEETDPSGQNTSETEQEETSGESPSEEINNYDQIIDTSKDDGKFSIYFINLTVSAEAKAKSGDSALLISPEGQTMLIDAGHPESGPIIIDFLNDLGIKKIDYFVASHPHIDHIGGFPAIAEEFEIGIAYRSNIEYTTNTYNNYVNAMEKHSIPVEYLQEGDEMDFGEEIKIKIYNPEAEVEYPKDFPENSTQFLNDNSIVMKFSYGESSALFGGDIYMTRERMLIRKYGEELQADIFKANHHGGDTSNSKPWIRNIQAEKVVAMHDKIDSMTVYNNFVDEGAEYYLTEENGIVKIVMDNNQNYSLISQFDSWMNNGD